jgi:hypothetical protein
MKMEKQDIWRLYWQAIDGSRNIASGATFNTAKGGATTFLSRCESLPGWPMVLELGPRVGEFFKDQATASFIGKGDARFLSDMPDKSGQRIVPGFDLKKAEEELRRDLALFVQVTGI